ncbi:MAG: Eco57I restriction-modification methylase domain-containing protein, partial [Candidatus Pacebacteria bacterium]|nr:Eco57I restriction-modification methylase domain-containing protein [Candidatus Paceibacterota bacterium]
DLESQNYKTFEKTGDLYALFYEKGLELSKKNTGILCFITSNKWMRAGYGKSLRQFFIEKNPKILIDLGGNVFESATVDTNILLIENNENKNNTLAISIKDNVENFAQQIEDKATQISFTSSDGWFIGNTSEIDLKKKIEKNGKPLKDWDVKIYRGVLTGLNEAFIIDKDTKERLTREDPKSEEIIRPILRGRDIKRYSYNFAELYILATGYDIDIPKLYPAIYKYLLQFEEKARSRDDKGKNWYNLRACVYYDEFEKEKVVWNRITSEIIFAYCPKSIFVLDSTFFITGIDVKVLNGILNSSVLK